MSSQSIILIYSLSFTLAFILTWISRSKNSNRLFDEKGTPAKSTIYLMGLHIGGILLLGVIPVFILQRSFSELVYGAGGITIGWFLLFAFLLLLVIVIASRAGNKIQIEDAGIHILSTRFLIEYFIVRTLFLCSYELFFRGLLLFDCIKYFDTYTAIIVSTLLTVLIHVFTNKKEMWGCIPFGIVLSGLCIAVHAVWPAILLHVALSMSYEIPAVNHYLTKLKPAR